MLKVERLALRVADEEVEDLQARLRAWRAPDAGPATGWEMGTPLGFATKLRDAWLELDWRKQEAAINERDNYVAHMDGPDAGMRVHFVLARPPPGTTMHKRPILLLHGWPGSFWEFHEVLPKLAARGFVCLAPSLPGYGFSDAPRTKGFSTRSAARVMDRLMRGLGFDEYYAQGGDWGSEICKALGSDAASGCVALHLNMHACGPPKQKTASAPEGPEPWTEEDKRRLERLSRFRKEGIGYQQIQGTRPQSLGYGLADSPMGLACWIAEKFSAWADTGGTLDPTRAVSLTSLLTNVSIYWFSNSITSSMRLYYETIGIGRDAPVRYPRVTVPCCIAELPEEIFIAPRPWIRAAFNVSRFDTFPRGGHFAALEVPDELVSSVATFFIEQEAVSAAAASSKAAISKL